MELLSLPCLAVIIGSMLTQIHCEPLQFAATCDDRMQFYTDGTLRAESDTSTDVSTFTVAQCPRVAAIHCVDVGFVGGMLASFSNSHVSYVTDTTWKCNNAEVTGWTEADFDDSAWTSAVVLPDRFFPGSYSGIAEGASWIWSTATPGQQRNVYCRKAIPNCGPESTTDAPELSTEGHNTTTDPSVETTTSDDSGTTIAGQGAVGASAGLISALSLTLTALWLS